MILRRSSVFRYLMLAGVGMFTYGEIFVYYVQAAFWPELDCPPNQPTCTKILFIADPQIQGDYAVPSPLHQIFSWDSDKYLKRTFNQAVNHLKPHILVYLGDLMDEGSISTTVQYDNYVKRLLDIFKEPYSGLQIWLPGDNDIGGEREPIKSEKIEAFKKNFNYFPNSVVESRNLAFYTVSGITHTKPKLTRLEGEDKIKIVISHYPLVRTGFGAQIHREINPHIYFCAHDHTAKYRRQLNRNAKIGIRSTSTPLIEFSKPLHIDLNGDYVNEIFVPTCSYRMGVPNMGYGAAVIDFEKKEMLYSVLWSPPRFPYLFTYLAFLFIICFYSILYSSYRLFVIYNMIQARKLQRLRADKDSMPLLP